MLLIAVLLLIALGVAIPVLRNIVIEGIERQRSGEATRTVDTDEASPPDELDIEGSHAVCSSCETPNDPEFSYCRECGSRL